MSRSTVIECLLHAPTGDGVELVKMSACWMNPQFPGSGHVGRCVKRNLEGLAGTASQRALDPSCFLGVSLESL